MLRKCMWHYFVDRLLSTVCTLSTLIIIIITIIVITVVRCDHCLQSGLSPPSPSPHFTCPAFLIGGWWESDGIKNMKKCWMFGGRFNDVQCILFSSLENKLPWQACVAIVKVLPPSTVLLFSTASPKPPLAWWRLTWPLTAASIPMPYRLTFSTSVNGSEASYYSTSN